MRLSVLLFILVAFAACSNTEKNNPPPSGQLSDDITPNDIHKHIEYLAQDSLKGRETGSAGAAIAARYIADYFKLFGLQPIGDDSTYYQQFTANMALAGNPHQTEPDSDSVETRLARNVVGMIKGTKHPGSYIVIGAHYDHLGMGEFGSLYAQGKPQIHNGADDNASGTSGLLELAQYFSKHRPRKSQIFVTFSGEELGLLGSQYFVENPLVPLDSVQAMINMDMVGRLHDDKLIIFGVGTSDSWSDLIKKANTESLAIQTVPDGTGASDHTSFYNKKIPVLHYFTDTHADYHRPSDDTQYINFEGKDRVLEHLRRLISEIDTLQADQLAYTKAPVTQDRNVTLQGPTLGVMPDYGYHGNGMRITEVHEGRSADKAGLKADDIIINLNGTDIKDIYDYMDVLNTLKEGQQTTVTVRRNGQKLQLDIRL